MNDIARGEWRSGAESPMYITSDCTADLDVFSPHNFTTTPEQAVATILRAGQDINCGGFMAAVGTLVSGGHGWLVHAVRGRLEQIASRVHVIRWWARARRDM